MYCFAWPLPIQYFNGSKSTAFAFCYGSSCRFTTNYSKVIIITGGGTGIGAATATRDFKAYKGLCKDNVIYDDVDKSYHRSNRFKRVWA